MLGGSAITLCGSLGCARKLENCRVSLCLQMGRRSKLLPQVDNACFLLLIALPSPLPLAKMQAEAPSTIRRHSYSSNQ